MIKYLSVCSGIEAATVAWHPLGWQPVAFSEIEKFPSQVLAHHYPDVPNLGDMTKFMEWNLESTIDVLVGGTPCQSFSVAGLRKGLHDPRGGLMLTFIEIAQRHRPRWIVWENVPGVLSSNGGRDFGSFLGALGQLGYGWAYRVLDAQWFGVAQRRRRVFVIGCLGDQRSAAAVLFESESVSRNPAPSREAREEVARSTQTSVGSESDPEVIALVGNTIGRKPENGGNGNGFTVGGPMYTLTKTDVHGVAQPMAFGVNEKPDVGHCLRSGASRADKHESTTYVAQTICLIDQGGSVMNVENNITGTLLRDTHGHQPVVMQQMAVRRLTPVECERLQGFPDGYTDIKENTPDGPRYKALGNSMAVPVMRWIGSRIQAIDFVSS